MKNIHILPTDKPSRLRYFNNKLELMYLIPKKSDIVFQNIYITSNEEIKKDDCFIGIKVEEDSDDNSFVIVTPKNKQQYKGSGTFVWVKKIILTTDQSLDGVQAIDDDFLEWFVKNPSCEEVEVKDVFKSSPIGFGNAFDYYKIIIPKEEPKPEYSKIKEGLKKSIEGKEHFIQHFKSGGSVEDFKPLETLEEAAKKYCESDKFESSHGHGMVEVKQSFIDGAKWQKERMYSEEDLRNAYFSAIQSTGEGWNGEYAQGNSPNIEETFQEEFNQWFEQFKTK